MRLSLLLTLLLAACYEIGGRGPSDDDTGSGDDDGSDDDAADDDIADDDIADDDVTDDDVTDDDTGDDDTGDDDTSSCSPDGATDCLGTTFRECQGGQWVSTPCLDPTPVCDDTLGCVACTPGADFCDGGDVFTCAPDGSGASLTDDCDASETCAGGDCLDACDLAASQWSYLGCQFLAASTSNIVSPTFDNDFAIVIGAPTGGPPANVTVSRGGTVVASQAVPAGQTAAITLPMVQELKAASQSVVAVDAAYEVVTDTPVVAYQYNPLHFDLGGEPSYTNDASLLLPEHALTGNYVGLTWPTWGLGDWTWVPFFGEDGAWDTWHPGWIAVAATEDNTQVTITASGITAPGNPGSLQAGQSTTVTLQRGDVMQVMGHIPPNSDDVNYCQSQGWDDTQVNCPAGFLNDCEAYCSVTGGDLSGTVISATAPVAVWAGHMCTFMPFDQWACDHLEEMSFPVETWGSSAIMAAPAAPAGGGVAATLYRVLALNAGTTVNFDPAVHGSVTLGAGEFVQFQSDQDFAVTASDRITVTQTMLGQDALGLGAGDPAMGTGIPLSQTRASYDILVPDSYTANWVNVIAPTGTTVQLDGTPVTGWQGIGATGYEVARVAVNPGGHHLESAGAVRFGITAYGYASYTSYLYPGGMNFTR